MPEPILLYRKMDDPDRAYWIKSGRVRCELTAEDTIEFSCKNALVGGGEIILSKEQGYNEIRHNTLYYIPDTENHQNQIIKLSSKQVLEEVKTFKVAFYIAKFLAMNLIRINKIRSEKNSKLKKSDELLKNYSIIYAKTLQKLDIAFKEKGFPWIEALVREGTGSLQYQKGKSFVSLENRKQIELDSDKLDKYNVKYPKGSFICKQGDKGNELYKLVRGRLLVLVNNIEVTQIEEGSVVGEMALLLGETRTATLKAMEDCIITVITKENLPHIIDDDKNFFKRIIISLSRWELISTNLVCELNEILKEAKTNTDEQLSRKKVMEYRTILKELRRKLSDLYNKYEQQFLYEISCELSNAMKELDEKYKKIK